MEEIQPIPSPPHLAVVAYDSLGDGLVYLMIADNLCRNGFQVTCYSTLAYSFRGWLPQLEIRPYPDLEQLDKELDGYDLVIMSPPSFVRKQFSPDQIQALARKYLLVCQKAPSHWIHDHSQRLRDRHASEIAARLLPLTGGAGRIRYQKFPGMSVVEMTLEYLRNRMQLTDVDKKVTLSPPQHLKRQRHRQRVIISPDSAGPAIKEWTPKRFLDLANALTKQGFDPHIVVSPKNHAQWLRRSGNCLPIPLFPSIGELAAFIYESGVVIANDSGNGHLASFIGVPTITIYRKPNPRFAWRPDWGSGAVVTPAIRVGLGQEKLWRPFISQRKIIHHVQAFTAPFG